MYNEAKIFMDSQLYLRKFFEFFSDEAIRINYLNATLKRDWFLYESNRVEILTTIYYELKKHYGVVFEFEKDFRIFYWRNIKV